MENRAAEQYLLVNQKYFPQEKLFILKEHLSRLTDSEIEALSYVNLKDPLIALVISLFLGCFGIDRFFIHDVALGILKLITFGGLGIWTIIDFILIMGKTREYNFNKIMSII